MLLCLIGGQNALAENGFKDPLNHPARMMAAVEKRPFMAIARAGERLVAVGSRGLIAVSTDLGKTWNQSKVPVQSDLLALHFPTPMTGWAVGHDGIVLRSDDGGTSWTKQLDGRDAAVAFRKHYEARAAAGDAAATNALQQLEQNFKAGPSLPYLDVWFKNIDVGYAVGSFGMLIATADGGKTWTPWLDKIDNEQSLNLNAIRGVGDEVLIAGEQGRIYVLNSEKSRFLAKATPFAGSFFGITASDKLILSFGLRGVVYKSSDQGRSWEEIKMPSEATISGGIFSALDQRFVLVNAAGDVLVGDPDASKFALTRPKQPMRFTGAVALPSQLVALTGLGGITAEQLP